MDIRAGVMLDRIDARLYVRNVFDERGLLSAYNWRGDLQPAVMQPRTVGISFTSRF
jgi:outer membrane receptor protein involved in Fe transport